MQAKLQTNPCLSCSSIFSGTKQNYHCLPSPASFPEEETASNTDTAHFMGRKPIMLAALNGLVFFSHRHTRWLILTENDFSEKHFWKLMIQYFILVFKTICVSLQKTVRESFLWKSFCYQGQYEPSFDISWVKPSTWALLKSNTSWLHPVQRLTFWWMNVFVYRSLYGQGAPITHPVLNAFLYGSVIFHRHTSRLISKGSIVCLTVKVYISLEPIRSLNIV